MFRLFVIVIALFSAPFFFVNVAVSQETRSAVKIIIPDKPDFTKSKKTDRMVIAEQQWCSGANPCNCRAGGYGYCTTAKECAEIGGQCY